MHQPVLVFDGHCHFCRRQASRLMRLSGDRLRLESFHDAGVLDAYPALTRQACEQAMQLVLADGRIYSGAAAAAQALRMNPLLKWVGSLYSVPGIKQAADRVYRWIADNRFRFGGSCTDGSCAHRG